jgi:hypothetical protein
LPQNQLNYQHVNFPPPQPPPRTCFSPQLTRDHYQATDEENAALQFQVSQNEKLLFYFTLCRFCFKLPCSIVSSLNSLSLTLFLLLFYKEKEEHEEFCFFFVSFTRKIVCEKISFSSLHFCEFVYKTAKRSCCFHDPI